MASAPSTAPASPTTPAAPPAPAVLVPPPPAAPPPAPPAKTAPAPPPLPPAPHDWPAAALSYLIPGLGQVYQGRIGKGLLFFFGLYGLFFYGLAMGQWRNVWLPPARDLPEVELIGWKLGGPAKALYYRPQFMAQFWIGTAAWPAVVQYAAYDKDQKAGPVFGAFERMPPEDELNALQRDGDKRWDLGWVYTVIAGILNLLVIYDALAGPMFRDPPPGGKPDDDSW